MYKFLAFILLTALIQSKSDLDGYWMKDSNDLIVNVFTLNSKQYAKITWFKDDNPAVQKYSENGLPKSKWLNHTVLYDLTKETNNKWRGKIFDVKNGKEYDAEVIKDGDKLTVTGYYFIPLFGKEIKFYKYHKRRP